MLAYANHPSGYFVKNPQYVHRVPNRFRMSSIAAYGAGVDEAGLRTALRWFVIGLPLALAYLVVVIRLHRGKAVAARDGEGY